MKRRLFPAGSNTLNVDTSINMQHRQLLLKPWQNLAIDFNAEKAGFLFRSKIHDPHHMAKGV